MIVTLVEADPVNAVIEGNGDVVVGNMSISESNGGPRDESTKAMSEAK